MYILDSGNTEFSQPLAMLKAAITIESDDEPFPQQAHHDMSQTSLKPKTLSRSRLFSHWVSTFLAIGHNSLGSAAPSNTCACRLRGHKLYVPANIRNYHQNDPNRQHHRVWCRSPRQIQTQNHEVESSDSNSNRNCADQRSPKS